jgi:rhodanese-related sulfurtransferase
MSFLKNLFGEPVPTIEAQELEDKLSNGRRPHLLDVREPVEFRHGHIAGAKLIPLGDLSVHLEELPKNREIVCICATGHRSVPAVRKLTAAGYTAVSLKDGMMAWQKARLPVQK